MAINLSQLLNKPGNVIQVVGSTYSTNGSTTSTAFVASGITATITPTYTNSKILVLSSGSNQASANENCFITLYRNSTNLGPANGMNITAPASVTYPANNPYSITYLDSPSTTSSTTYTLYYRCTNGVGVNLPTSNTLATITLLEIAQ